VQEQTQLQEQTRADSTLLHPSDEDLSLGTPDAEVGFAHDDRFFGGLSEGQRQKQVQEQLQEPKQVDSTPLKYASLTMTDSLGF